MTSPDKKGDYPTLRSIGYDPKFEGAMYPGFAPEIKLAHSDNTRDNRGGERIGKSRIGVDPYGAPDPKMARPSRFR